MNAATTSQSDLSRIRPACCKADGAFYTMLDTSGTIVGGSRKMRSPRRGYCSGSAFGIESEGFLRVSFCANARRSAGSGADKKSAATLTFQNLRDRSC